MDFVNNLLSESNFLLSFIELLVKLTVVLAIIALVCMVLKQYSPNLRRILWLSAVVAILALPLAASLLPRWQMPAFNQAQTVSTSTGVPQTFQTSGEVNTGIPAPESLLTDTEVVGTRFNLSNQWQGLLTATVFFVWCLGLLLFAYRLSSNALSNNALRNRALKISSQKALAHQPGFPEIGINDIHGQSVNVFVSDEIATPLAVGIFRPAVLLPYQSLQWSDDRRNTAILHELGHIRHHDNAWRFAASLATAIYWFHPLVWYAARKLVEEQEKSADDFVVARGISRSSYAQSLMEIVRAMNGNEHPSQLATSMASYNFFPERMRALLKDLPARQTLSRGKVSILFALLLSVITPLVLITTQAPLSIAQDEKTSATAQGQSDRASASAAIEKQLVATDNEQVHFQDLDAKLSTNINRRDFTNIADRFTRAINSADLNTLLALHTPDAIYVSDEEDHNAAEVLQEHYREFYLDGWQLNTKLQSSSMLNNDRATAVVDLVLGNKGSEKYAELLTGTAIAELVAVNDEWKIARIDFSDADLANPQIFVDSIQDMVQGFINLGQQFSQIGQPAQRDSQHDKSSYDSEDSPLHTAIKAENEQIVEMLVLRDADVNQADRYGNSPLHLAARTGNTQIMEMLLLKGADVNAVNQDGKTVLQDAIARGNEEMVEMLIEGGAAINKPRTP